VFPDWLRKAGLNGEGIREYSGSDGVSRFQAGGPFSKKIKIVCGLCNSQWMSGMELAAKPLLVSMFRSGDGQLRLDEDDQLVLVRWAFKTAAVLTQVDGRAPFPSALRREFRRTNQPPANCFVRIGTASLTNQALGLQVGEFKHRRHNAEVRVDGGLNQSGPAYVSRFRLLNVVFEVFGIDIPTVQIDVAPSEDLSRALLPLWPRQHDHIWWPPSSLDSLGGIDGLLQIPLVGIPMLQSSSQPTAALDA
jgi:hypothetical protein